ncbi:zinc-binding dehydrogenase [Bifidobacterium dentium]|uniref:zinc-binding dehydrogenase n=1 Tax=Bifidobacterium dentium TaxID=1689 RepID=UPI0030C6FDDB
MYLRGSNGGTPDDIRGVYELMRTGKLSPVTTCISFDEVPQAIERLEAGDVKGRLVIRYE